MMEHVRRLSGKSEQDSHRLRVRATGRFYTPLHIAERLAEQVTCQYTERGTASLRVCDPFGGDGRLVLAFLRAVARRQDLRQCRWAASVWDCHAEGLRAVREEIESLAIREGLKVVVDVHARDTFLGSQDQFGQYDFVVTNPPWEALKPDRRELQLMAADERKSYEASLRDYDRNLAAVLPESQPKAKFSGWGTNLSRCGLELSLRLLKNNGICGIVLPSSVFTDQVSEHLRRWVFGHAAPERIDFYPAETKLFEGVDQNCVTAIFVRGLTEFSPNVVRYGRDGQPHAPARHKLTTAQLERLQYCVPLDVEPALVAQLLAWQDMPLLADLEGGNSDGLWLGRELDETNLSSFTAETGKHPFAKGRMVTRYAVSYPQPPVFIRDGSREIPTSVRHPRIAWRDVSRRSQARRVQATLLPPGVVTGNSLHVGFFRDDDLDRLHALLAIFNSIPFEFQVRSRLGTGHVSLGAVRHVHVPDLRSGQLTSELSGIARAILAGAAEREAELEVAVAVAYGLTPDAYKAVLAHFSGVPEGYKEKLVVMLENRQAGMTPKKVQRRASKSRQPEVSGPIVIPNHYTASLSKMDLDIAVSIPPGGNWKNVPKSIPSKRLETIRVSFAAGEGSRSTYYGRLRPDRPSYTINTYFNRPGNGCHLHYDVKGGQHRVLSEREAARLQSFPDSFVFKGGHESVRKQIGNAVPPLLAYQIARSLPFVGRYVDLFSGAGGLSLGFKWAGWTPVVANDIEPSFLETYRANVHDQVVVGDIRDREVFEQVVAAVECTGRARRQPLFVIGGPPCQGFSTAGKKRTLEDARNHLFKQFKALIHKIKPDGFIFENVTGLLNMDGGAVFEMIRDELQLPGRVLVPWLLRAERYAVPQRRTRLILLSLEKKFASTVQVPPELTVLEEPDAPLFGSRKAQAITVEDAIGDLPPLTPGEDGSCRNYASSPHHPYQSLMRSVITPAEYFEAITSAVGRDRSAIPA